MPGQRRVVARPGNTEVVRRPGPPAPALRDPGPPRQVLDTGRGRERRVRDVVPARSQDDGVLWESPPAPAPTWIQARGGDPTVSDSAIEDHARVGVAREPRLELFEECGLTPTNDDEAASFGSHRGHGKQSA